MLEKNKQRLEVGSSGSSKNKNKLIIPKLSSVARVRKTNKQTKKANNSEILVSLHQLGRGLPEQSYLPLGRTWRSKPCTVLSDTTGRVGEIVPRINLVTRFQDLTKMPPLTFHLCGLFHARILRKSSEKNSKMYS